MSAGQQHRLGDELQTEQGDMIHAATMVCPAYSVPLLAVARALSGFTRV